MKSMKNLQYMADKISEIHMHIFFLILCSQKKFMTELFFREIEKIRQNFQSLLM